MLHWQDDKTRLKFSRGKWVWRFDQPACYATKKESKTFKLEHGCDFHTFHSMIPAA